jgi:hypothetical protein
VSAGAWTFTVKITPVDGANKPVIGTVLCSGTLSGSGAFVYQLKEISLGAGYDLTVGTRYAIVLYDNQTGVTDYWKVVTTNYANGQCWLSTNSGGTWSEIFAPYDFSFEEWGYIYTIPGGVTSFNVVNNGDNTTTATWSMSANATSVRLVRNYIEYPAGLSSPTNIYEGALLTYHDIGLIPWFDKCYSIWEHNAAGWSTSPAQATIGREVMNVTINQLPAITTIFPVAMYGIAIGLVLIVINLKANSALLWLGASICFIGVWFDPSLNDTYYQAAAIVVIIFCWLCGFFAYRKKRAGLG